VRPPILRTSEGHTQNHLTWENYSIKSCVSDNETLHGELHNGTSFRDSPAFVKIGDFSALQERLSNSGRT